jgi:hypothetical protein
MADPMRGDLVRHKESGELLGLVTDIHIWGYKKHYDVLYCDGSGSYTLRDYQLESVN